MQTSRMPPPVEIADNNFCLGSVIFCSTNVVPCTTYIFLVNIINELRNRYKSLINNPKSSVNHDENIEIQRALLIEMTKCTLLPFEMHIFPESDRYMVSSQPLGSSPRSLNGTG
jgi:hypothetical protein